MSRLRSGDRILKSPEIPCSSIPRPARGICQAMSGCLFTRAWIRRTRVVNKSLYVLIIGTGLAASALAQETSSLLKPVNELPTLGNQSTAKDPSIRKSGDSKASKPKETKGPTEITSTKGVTFD